METENCEPVTNTVEAVLGCHQLKWDAFWHLFEWLIRPDEGHRLDGSVLEHLCVYAFGQSFPLCQIKREWQISEVRDGKGKWVDLVVAIPSLEAPTHIIVMDDVDLRTPGSSRKIENLISYRALTRNKYSAASVRAVALTNANDGSNMQKLYAGLGPEALDCSASDGWKLLPVQTVGGWVSTALGEASDTPANVKSFLADFVKWSQSLDSHSANHTSTLQTTAPISD